MTSIVAGLFSVAYFGERALTASDVAILQAAGWVVTCPDCKGRLLVDHLAGSPLSGSGYLKGACENCGRVRIELHRLPAGTCGQLATMATRLFADLELMGGNVKLEEDC